MICLLSRYDLPVWYSYHTRILSVSYSNVILRSNPRHYTSCTLACFPGGTSCSRVREIFWRHRGRLHVWFHFFRTRCQYQQYSLHVLFPALLLWPRSAEPLHLTSSRRRRAIEPVDATSHRSHRTRPIRLCSDAGESSKCERCARCGVYCSSNWRRRESRSSHCTEGCLGFVPASRGEDAEIRFWTSCVAPFEWARGRGFGHLAASFNRGLPTLTKWISLEVVRF